MAAAAAASAAEAAASASAAAVVASRNGSDDREYSTLDDWVEYFKFKKGRDSDPDEARNALLVIAVLITTATYQSVLSPPGGLWQDNTRNGDHIHTAGKTILGTHTINYAFGVFIITNTAGFYGSLFVIEILTRGFPLRLLLWFTVLALIASYDSAMISIIPKGRFSVLFAVLSIILPLIIVFVAKMVRKLWNVRLDRRLFLHLRQDLAKGHHSKVSTPLQVMESSGP